jgi:hypothetical protein
MTKKEKIALQATIQRALENRPSGMTRGELQSELPSYLRVRSIQRLLKDMAGDDLLTVSGEKSGTRYHPAYHATGGGEGILVSAEPVLGRGAREVQLMVSLPLAQRRRIGYQPNFLLDYVPGVTWYLSEEERHMLAMAGAVHDETQPAGTYARHIIDRLMIDLSWASSHLEGNTYSLLDTRMLIERGQAAAGKEAEETQMILNHKRAIELLVENEDLLTFNRVTFSNLHAVLSQNLLPDMKDEGRLRRQGVGISGSMYAPLSVPQQIEEFFDQLLSTAGKIDDAFEQAFFILVHLPYLQPFADVNKRVSRLGANISLIKSNYCPLSFLDVSKELYVQGLLGVYEFNRIDLLRDVFVHACIRSAARYKTIKDAVVEPDGFRLMYRALLTEGVSRLVKEGDLLLASKVKKLVMEDAVFVEGIPEKVRHQFTDLLLEEMLNLFDGNYMRYGLRPSEFELWKGNQ